MSRLWFLKRKGDALFGIGTGYCFLDDGLWRQHSWGVRKKGLLETLGERDRYFGIVMIGIEADVSAFRALYDDNPTSELLRDAISKRSAEDPSFNDRMLDELNRRCQQSG